MNYDLRIKNYLVFSLFFLFWSCNSEKAQEKVNLESFKNYNKSAKELTAEFQNDKSNLNILINKSEYKLSLRYKDQVLKEYPVVFGDNPVDDKRMEGDRCTPEGQFKIRDLYPHKKWSKFLWIDYPTKDSERKFKESKSKGEIPEDVTIGGEVGIHGVPKDKDNLILEKQNWTWGCISLQNKDVDDLYSVAFKGMEVLIIKN
ncbi:MAG: L,D-transpeptidase [Crocinitomicaceae bacterium]|nr:L,D-transpeptidase [Crocinitomicaceae bacterium]